FGGRHVVDNGIFVLNVHPKGPLGIGTDHGDVHVVMADAVAAARNVSELFSQPAADGVVVVVGKGGVEMPVEAANVSYAHGAPAVGAGLENCFLFVFVVFVFNIAHDLLEDIFHGDKPGCSAMFVNDNGQVVTAAAEVVQQYIKPLCFGNKNGGPHQ